MEVGIVVTVPRFIYDIYANAAKKLGNYTVEQTMSCALQAYAQHLFEEIQSNGELSDDASQGDSV